MMMRPDREADDSAEVPPASQYLPNAEIIRLAAEVRNAVEFIRRGIRLPEEENDGDDNLTVVLEDLDIHIGNAVTGLSIEVILENLRRCKYQNIAVGPPVEDEKCCICQEEFADGEDLGKLDCKHYFHFSCIKKWLMEKNSCPICKATALAV